VPLYFASLGGFIDIVHSLLAAHARVDIANSDGMTPLFVASRNGHVDTVHALLGTSADVNKSDARGRTPLDVAIHFNHESITNILIEAGALSGPEADDWSYEEDE
jgi:ankyrin repeat protein